MKERPILFNGDMVRAILEGRKTQTRRVAPIADLKIRANDDGITTWSVRFSKPIKGVRSSHSGGEVSEEQARSIIASRFCPYGQSGDRLWLRETWSKPFGIPDVKLQGRVTYRADFRQSDVLGMVRADGAMADGVKWNQSIHMPRWASRITLEIVSVRVERLNEISEADCIAEGIEPDGDFFGDQSFKSYGNDKTPCDAFCSYESLWESINGAGSWEQNPWVWVVEFKRVQA